ncbi:MAG: DNA repair protein RecN [Lentimicrobiaceae bacterium]|nr:DNA repair protein RecN [Lentimicrobiaceae bacterium]
MLQKLSISNYALIASLSVDFDNGFSVITGETGAGKSILLGALGFVLGNRADSNILFDETKKCVVEATFFLQDTESPSHRVAERLKSFFEENDIDFDEECIIRRELTPQKKSRSFINDTPVSLQILKELGAQLVDIHSQHDSLLLCNPDFQLSLLDDAANNNELLMEYQKSYRQYTSAKNELLKLRQKSINNIDENDYLKFQLDEMLKANLLENEYEELYQKIEFLENQEEINRLLAESTNILENENQSLLDGLNTLLYNVDKLKRYVPELDSMSERLNSVKIELKDICSDLNNLQEDSADISSLEMLQERFDIIQRLMMKHHLNDYSQLLQLREDIKKKVDEFSNIDEILEDKDKEVKKLEKDLMSKASELNKRRLKAKTSFEKEVTSVIHQLAMPYAVFEIKIENVKELNANGTDAVTFMFSANKGYAPENMAKAASGGELSRLMLAIKSVAAKNNYIPTLIFDEIDTGVSGEVASKLGDIMKVMGETLQLVSITHLPQVASKAKNHFFVYKDIVDEKTRSNIRTLTREERIMEIAKMLSNAEVTAEAMRAAEVLIN